MKGKRTERLIRIASRMLTNPSRPISLTETAVAFNVSKTLISDDVEIISNAIAEEGIGNILTDRGRTGGSYFIPSLSCEYRTSKLTEIANILSVPERLLPSGLVYYTDLLFDPAWASFLGFTVASMFIDKSPNVVITSEVKGIPVAFFTAYALGVPLAVCRFRNRPSDGSAVGVHYPTGSDDIRTMYLGTKLLTPSCNVLVVDDFMRGGSTISGMLTMVREFGSSVAGIGVFISSHLQGRRAPFDYKSLLELTVEGGTPKLHVSAN